MRRTPKTTSLWSVIDKMQSRLEAEGLDRDVVDAAIACGLEALLDLAPPDRTARSSRRPVARARALWMRPGGAKA